MADEVRMAVGVTAMDQEAGKAHLTTVGVVAVVAEEAKVAKVAVSTLRSRPRRSRIVSKGPLPMKQEPGGGLSEV